MEEFDADADAVNKRGTQPFYWAGRHGNTEILKLLLRHTKEPPSKSEAGINTALKEAAQNGYLDAVKMLLAHGAICNLAKLTDIKGEHREEIKQLIAQKWSDCFL